MNGLSRSTTGNIVTECEDGDNLKLTTLSFVEIKATDGFASVFPLSRLIENKNAKAYIAIEEKANAWPKITKKNQSAGPFYLIWIKGAGADIQPEEWPYQIASMHAFDDMKLRYPKIFPHKEFPTAHAINKGLEIFVKNCMVCHTMNLEGAAQMGPDMNMPFNPTEYLKEDYFKILVRDPQKLRHWKKSQMSSFSNEVLSDEDLGNLIRYLRHMSEKKYP
jgi:mono/diheme cytochrome c family protein